MSQENVEIVRAMWAAWATGDYDTALGAFAHQCCSWGSVSRSPS
jgi:hypothetical protein